MERQQAIALRSLSVGGLAETLPTRRIREFLWPNDQVRYLIGTLAIVLPVFAGILVADWILWPGRNLDILYAVPVLIAALYVSPRFVAGIAVLATVADAIGAMIARDPLGSWAVTLPSLVIVCVFGVVLAERRLQGVVHAAEADKARADLQRFFGMVAHDLAGHLTALSTYAETLQRSDLDATLYARVGAGIVQVVERTSRFVDDLRDAARVGQGNFVLHRQPTDLPALAREIIERKRRAVGNSMIALDAPNAISGMWDATRLGQVLDNLLDNAIKYAGGGDVRVTLERSASAAICRVSDHGPGIPVDKQEHLFDPFFRLDPTKSGTGLGLYIARELIAAHGGHIGIESQPGCGSTFFFMLPLANET